MDRISKISGVYRSGGVAGTGRGQEGRASAAGRSESSRRGGRQSALDQGMDGQRFEEQGAGEQSGKRQNPQPGSRQQSAQTDARQLTRQEAREQYFAQQQARGQQFARQHVRGHSTGEQQDCFGKEGAAGISGQEEKGQAAQRRKSTAEKNQEFWKAYMERQQEKEKESHTVSTILDQLKEREEAFKKAMDPKNKKNLYDATMDLMLVEQAEKTAALKGIQTRLLFKMRSVKNSGAKASEIRAAVNKIKKVIGKVKGKIKNLRKEDQLEKKRRRAEEQKRKERERALRLELERRRKIRKVKERGDVEESKMGLGANYGGTTDPTPAEIAAMAYGSTGEAAAPPVETGGTVDVAVADMGAAADAGAVDVSL